MLVGPRESRCGIVPQGYLGNTDGHAMTADTPLHSLHKTLPRDQGKTAERQERRHASGAL